jgi:hypothetical protein
VLVLRNKVITGIDLAGKQENPTGYALWKTGVAETSLIYTDGEILEKILRDNPCIIAVDAPFSFPIEGTLRVADKKMIKNGYKVFPPRLQAMEKLTKRAIRLNKLIAEKGYKAIEVHPTSTRKALDMPTKDYSGIQEIYMQMGLEGTTKERSLTSHELDAITAALTAHLYIKGQTRALGDKNEGYIIIPKRQNWRTLKL